MNVLEALATLEMKRDLQRLKRNAYKREYARKARDADPLKARTRNNAWYAANKEKINEPKRRAAFEAVERYREEAALYYGKTFVPRVYEVFTTNDPRTFRSHPNPVTPCAQGPMTTVGA